jgi:hypothetical protein
MPSPFDALHERLLCAGVAPRCARRYLGELREHFTDLVADETAAGSAPLEAEARALQRLGDTETLAKAMIERPQFRAWSARAPLAAYLLAPPVLLALCSTGAVVAMVVAYQFSQPPGGGHSLPPSWFAALATGLGPVTAWVAPVLLGWGVALQAIRQRAGRLWPLLGITAVAVLGAVAQLDISLPTLAGGHGEVDIASVFAPPFIGTGLAALHAAASLLIAGVPYLVAERLWRPRLHPS